MAELADDAELAALMVPDLDTDDDGTPDGLSFGVGVSAIAATFRPRPY